MLAVLVCGQDARGAVSRPKGLDFVDGRKPQKG